MIKNFIIKAAIVSVLFLLNFSIANAKCKFMMDIGDKYTDSHKDKYGILYGEYDNQYAEVNFPASDFCPNDNFDDNFFIRYTFISDGLAAIQLFADNSIDNSATESMKLMKY